jgi:DNA-binding transcriptional MerR regulator
MSDAAYTNAEQAHISKLTQLGYGEKEIQKIIKKIGFPKPENSGSKKDGQHLLTVGDLAERTGLSPRTIKHWEDKGIISPDTRSDGGFRLYSQGYIFLCNLIKDLQLFGYSLEEIKVVSDYFRDFSVMHKDITAFNKTETAEKIETLLKAIEALSAKMKEFKQGIERWEGLLKKKKKEIGELKKKNQKRS